MKINKTLASILAGGMLLAAGCGQDQSKMRAPTREDFKVYQLMIDGKILYDINKDGEVEGIETVGRSYVVPEYLTNFPRYISENAQVMNPKMREAGSKIIQGYIELNFQRANEQYEAKRGYPNKSPL